LTGSAFDAFAGAATGFAFFGDGFDFDATAFVPRAGTAFCADFFAGVAGVAVRDGFDFEGALFAATGFLAEAGFAFALAGELFALLAAGFAAFDAVLAAAGRAAAFFPFADGGVFPFFAAAFGLLLAAIRLIVVAN
jgi:hypothetical protein